ncbi:MAG: hypothetical protein R3E79_36650 [Caldilineaceae bacterium]
MSLYRPVPPLHLAANVTQALSPLALRDYGKLLYWIFFFPQAVRDYTVVGEASETENRKGRQRHLVEMALLLFILMVFIIVRLISFGQIRFIEINQPAALDSAVNGALIGLISASFVYLFHQWKQQPAHAIVLGIAAGITSTIISMFFLGELWDPGMLDMFSAPGYGVVGGISAGVMMNLALVLNDKLPGRSLLQWGAAFLFGVGIFLVNSVEQHVEYWVFALDLSEENLWAILGGILAFYGGTQLGIYRPLDWVLGKIYLNIQLYNQPTVAQFLQFTEGTAASTHYAPGIEAIFAPTAPTPLTVQPYLPHVTLFPVQQLRFLIETWLEHDWERGLANAKQIWRYTRQRPVTSLSLQQILHEGKPDDQLGQVSKFVDKLDGDDWPMLFYTKQKDSKTVESILEAKQATIKDALTLATVRGQSARTRSQRRLLRQAMKTTQLPKDLPLDTTAQRAVAGFWYLTNSFAEEGGLAFQDLPNSDLVQEVRAIATSFEKLLFTKELLAGTALDLPECPKEPKRKPTWDAIDKFKAVVRYGRLYHQCHNTEKKMIAYETALLHLNNVEREASKLPGAERSTILALALLWYQELSDWEQATRSWQKMKPENPFIFHETLRGRKPFVGREDTLKALKQAGSRGSLQPVLLYGLTKSGKSSLLHKAMFDYHNEICFAPFNVPDPGTGVLSVEQILWAMCQGLQRRVQQPLPSDKDFKNDPEAAAEATVRAICYRFKTPLVIVVGNVHLLYTVPTKPILHKMAITSGAAVADHLLTFWWNLSQNIGNLSFVFVSQSAQFPTTPFTPLLKKLQVGNLEFKDVEKLLATPTPTFTPHFSRRAMALIYYLSGGQPYLVQMIAYHVVDQFNRELDKDTKPEPVFLEADIDKILVTESFRQFSLPYFQNLCGQLEHLCPGSNTVLHTIAQYVDGITTPNLTKLLAGLYSWTELEIILGFLQTQQVIKLDAGHWQVNGELLRQYLA